MNIILGISESPNVVNHGSIKDFVTYVYLDSFSYFEDLTEVYFDVPNLKSKIPHKIPFSEIHNFNYEKILVPPQKPLMEEYLEHGYENSQSLQVIEYLKNTPNDVEYLLQDSSSRDHEILKELSWFKPTISTCNEDLITFDIERLGLDVCLDKDIHIVSSLPYIPEVGPKETASDFVTYDQVKDYTVLQLLELNTLAYVCNDSFYSKIIGQILLYSNGVTLMRESPTFSQRAHIRYDISNTIIQREELKKAWEV